MSIVKKRIGRSLLLQEVEKLLGKGIDEHIRNNGLRVIGQPLPNKDDIDSQNWDEPDRFNFEYELGLAPDFEVQFKKKLKVTYPVVKIDDKLIDKEVNDMRRRFGSLEDTEVTTENDLVVADLVELNEDKTIKEGGILSKATIAIEFLEDEATKKAMTGLKVGDELNVDPHKISKGHEDLARMLNVPHEEVHDLKGEFLLRVVEAKKLKPAELNQQLFDRLYGKDEVKNETDLRGKVKERLAQALSQDSDHMYRRLVLKALMEKLKLKLPDEFLKRWILETSDKPVTPEEVEKDYHRTADGLRMQLIEDHIVQKFGLEAKQEELIEAAKQRLAEQYAMYGLNLPEGDDLNNMLGRFLRDREEIRRLRETIVDRKLTAHFKAMLTPKEKEMSYDDLVNLAKTI